MPCLNEQIHKDSFFTDNKYNDNFFCYAGATVNWQCFEETVALYAKIEQEQQYKNCKLLLLVKNKELAMKYIEKYQVKNFEIDFVTVEELPEKLKKVKFGFLLRQESPVNAVATPTKMATYLSNGIIPIYSKALSGMEEMLKDTKYTIALSNFQDIEAIEPYLDRKIDPQEIYEDYKQLFDTVYNREQHIRTMQKVLEDKERIQWFAAKYANAHDVFFVGRGIDYAVCLEGSLKLKEISYIHSETYAAGELKHGTISLIEQGTLVIGVLTQSELYEKTVSNMVECKSRGAYLMGLTTYGNYEIEDQVNFTVYVPKVDEHFVGSLAVIPLQLMGYYVSVAKGLDVDKPRNLAKSVTVE